MTLRLAPTPLLLLQLMEFLQVAAKVTVMYEEERKVSYTHKSVLLGEPEYTVSVKGVSQDVSYDVSYSVPYYEVPYDMPFDIVLTALKIGSELKVEEDNLLPGFSIDFLVAALAGPRLLSR